MPFITISAGSTAPTRLQTVEKHSQSVLLWVGYRQHLHDHHQPLADTSAVASLSGVADASGPSSSVDVDQILTEFDLKIFFRGISHGEWRQMEEKAKAIGEDISVFDSATQLASYTEQQQNA